MRFTIISIHHDYVISNTTINANITVCLCDLSLSLCRFILQYVYMIYCTIITIQVHITVSLCDIQLSLYWFILQYVYVTYRYHHTVSCYSMSMWYTFITIEIHTTVSLCDIQLSSYRFILQYVYRVMLQYVYVTFIYHHTDSYYSKSMRHTIIIILVHIAVHLCDLELSQYRFNYSTFMWLIISPYRLSKYIKLQYIYVT
jgi:hypothetical protein